MDLLLDNFKYLTHTPKNLAQLKKLVLQLAVQGKLTVKWREENPDVEPATVLLEKIKAEKENLTKKGLSIREVSYSTIEKELKPYMIPKNWAWCSLCQLADIVRGGSPRPAGSPTYYNGAIPFLKVADITKNENVYLNDFKYSIKEAGLNSTRLVAANTLLLTNSGATLGVPKICTFPTTFNDGVQAFINLTELVDKVYLYYFLRSETENMRKKAENGGQPNLNTEMTKVLLCPIPPLTEQHAIVSKVEILFAQIDQLHELSLKKASITDNSAKALFGKINTITGIEDLQITWQLLTSNFNAVTQSKEGVNQLRQTILQLAFQGKLTTQWRVENPDAFPASTILEEIKTEKQQLTKEGKLRKELHVHKIAQNEQPFKVPVSWEWDRMGAISQHNSGKTLDSGRNKGELQKYITTSNLYWGYFKLDNVKSFLISDNELDRCSAVKGDLLICEGGEAGRTAVWEEPYSICFQNHIHRVRLYGNINPYFVFRYFQKLNFSGEINEYRKGMGISNMSSGSLASIPIPIPPIAEQEVIVSNINHLMSLCDELEKKIEKRDSYQERIMQAVVKQAFVV